MEAQQQTTDKKALLVHIPDQELTERQRELAVDLLGENYGPIYTFTREPKSLGEIKWRERLALEDPDVIIWRESETFTFVADDDRIEFSVTRRSFAFAMFLGEQYHRPYSHLSFRVLGKTDAAVLETATFFCSLKHQNIPKCLCDSTSAHWKMKEIFRSMSICHLTRGSVDQHIRVEPEQTNGARNRQLESGAGQDFGDTIVSVEFATWQSA
jgi:hypothetical protein